MADIVTNDVRTYVKALISVEFASEAKTRPMNGIGGPSEEGYQTVDRPEEPNHE